MIYLQLSEMLDYLGELLLGGVLPKLVLPSFTYHYPFQLGMWGKRGVTVCKCDSLGVRLSHHLWRLWDLVLAG